MNEDKNKKVVTTKKVIVTNKPQPQVQKQVQEQPKVEDEGVSQNVDAHLQENLQTLEKKKVDFKTVATYAIMVIIVIACIVLIYVFLDKNGMNPFIPKETTTTADINKISTTKPTTRGLSTNTTQPVETKATHQGGMRGNNGNGTTSPTIRTAKPKEQEKKETKYNIVLYNGGTQYVVGETTLGGTPVKKQFAVIAKGDYHYNHANGTVVFHVEEEKNNGTITCSMSATGVINCSVS